MARYLGRRGQWPLPRLEFTLHGSRPPTHCSLSHLLTRFFMLFSWVLMSMYAYINSLLYTRGQGRIECNLVQKFKNVNQNLSFNSLFKELSLLSFNVCDLCFHKILWFNSIVPREIVWKIWKWTSLPIIISCELCIEALQCMYIHI